MQHTESRGSRNARTVRNSSQPTDALDAVALWNMGLCAFSRPGRLDPCLACCRHVLYRHLQMLPTTSTSKRAPLNPIQQLAAACLWRQLCHAHPSAQRRLFSACPDAPRTPVWPLGRRSPLRADRQHLRRRFLHRARTAPTPLTTPWTWRQSSVCRSRSATVRARPFGPLCRRRRCPRPPKWPG